MQLGLYCLAAATAATLVLAQPHTRGFPSMNPDPSVLNHARSLKARVPASKPLTNGERFARKLPPLQPKSHRRMGRNGGPFTGGTHVRAAPRAESSPTPPTTIECILRLVFQDGTAKYIDPNLNEYGEYSNYQDSPGLRASMLYSPDSPSRMALTPQNGSPNYPCVGGIVGFASSDDNFSSGSFNYATFGGTPSTPAGAPPTEGENSFSTATKVPGDYESNIWTYDPSTKKLSPQWINTDSSNPATFMCIASADNLWVMTGDMRAVEDAFGSCDPVALECV